jgi:hypothetical protein
MNLNDFEQKHEKLASIPVFAKRVAASFGLSAALVLGALFIGVAGYHWIAGFAWVDSLLEASMILGGMGPISQLPSDGAKIFASAYALFSGLVFIAGMSIVLSPIVHRMLHKFHVDEKDVDN